MGHGVEFEKKNRSKNSFYEKNRSVWTFEIWELFFYKSPNPQVFSKDMTKTSALRMPSSLQTELISTTWNLVAIKGKKGDKFPPLSSYPKIFGIHNPNVHFVMESCWQMAVQRTRQSGGVVVTTFMLLYEPNPPRNYTMVTDNDSNIFCLWDPFGGTGRTRSNIMFYSYQQNLMSQSLYIFLIS